MKALVTGGAGFVGSHLCEELLQRGYKVHIIDDLSTGSLDNIKLIKNHPNLKITIDTILNKSVLEEIAEGANQIYHLAAAVGVRLIVEQPLRTIQTNIEGTQAVLDVANRLKAKLLLTSTSEIYGKNENVPFTEESDRILGPTSVNRWSYSVSKAVDEILGLAYFREKGLPVVIVRLFNTCGPRQTGQYGMVIPRFVKQALSGLPITIFGDGSQTRSFTYVNDVIQAIMLLMDNEKASGQIFNIGNDQEVSILEVAKRIVKLANSSSKIEFVPYEIAYEKGFEDMKRRVPCVEKLKTFTGFRPSVSLDELLIKVIDFMRK